MPFTGVSRDSLEFLNQNIRAPGISPGGVPSARGNAVAPDDPTYKVVDEFIRSVPFVASDIDGKPFARQFQVTTTGDISELPFTARGSSTPWVPGATIGFGEELDTVGTRFKKISTVVRSDELMQTGVDDDILTVQSELAWISVIRSLSEALLHSVPATDDHAEFSGLPYYLGASSPQEVTFDTTRGVVGGLSEIEARCAPGDDGLGSGPDVFVMSSRVRWRLLKELEDKGVMPDFQACPITEKLQLHFHGVPVLTGRVPEPGDESRLTEAWALRLYGPSGIRVLHIGGDDFGVRTEPDTTVTTIDASGEADSASRGIEVFGVYSLLVPDTASIARLRAIPASDPFPQP